MIAEFLIIAIVSDPKGEMTVRNACGSTIRRSVCAYEKPRDSDASIWPLPTEKTPERSASATYAAVYSPSEPVPATQALMFTSARRSPA
jgi:hypothetical protein